jgi:DNA-directed RNA polymerase subunit beta'
MLSTRKIINNNLYSYEKNKLTKIETFSSSLLFCKAKTLPNYWICQSTKNQFFLVRFLCPIWRYNLSLSQKIIVKPGNFVDIGEPLTEGIIDIHDLLSILFRYHSTIDGTMLGTLRSLNKFQLLLVNSVQAIYESQNVTISSKHIEIIIRQMTSKVVIKRSGDTPFLPGEVVRLSMISQLYKAFKGDPNISAIGIDRKKQKSYRTPKYEPLLLSTTNSSLRKDGFLSAAGFQETKKILTKAAIEGSSDWLRALKECVIVGRLIPAGSSFLNYKNYLDNIFLYKTKIV